MFVYIYFVSVFYALEVHGVECFLDEHELLPGDRLPAKLGKAMEESRAAVICIGPNGEGGWQSEEIDSLLSKGIDLLVEMMSSGSSPFFFPGADSSKLRWFLKTRIWVDLSKGITDNETELFRLRNAIMDRAEHSPLQTDSNFNPYRGLEAFGLNDAPFFFGRAQQCRDLAAKVKEWRLPAS